MSGGDDPRAAIPAKAARLYAELHYRSEWSQSDFFGDLYGEMIFELCDKLRELGSADGVVIETTFDEFNVYVKTVPSGQSQLF